MNESDFIQLREAGWRRRLAPDEETQLRSWLLEHPQSADDWRDETALNTALASLPDAPVPSNFTALVLQQVDRAAAREDRSATAARWWHRLRLGWLPRAAGAAVVVLLLGVGGWQYQNFRHQQMAHGLVQFSFAAAAVPEPQVFGDFDAIRRLNPAPPATDEALFVALNQ